MVQPDVTVIVPVYNTMPYLTACLESLVGQTIGNLEVIAVDDGSTDGCGAEVDRFAAEHPDVVRAVHQANSGGPAGPCNRGLELATGRFVFFVGADDYLGPEALERLVDAADRWSSDVVLAKVAGVGGRAVENRMYAETLSDVDLFSSRLPYALANIKLFRRSLIEDHGLRFPEDLRMGSDQPFTLQALLHSGRTSVLADYDYYFAVRREDSSNITFSSSGPDRIAFTARMMDLVASLVVPGPLRDAILIRHFDWEINETVQLGYLDSSEEDRRVVRETIARLVDDYLTEPLSHRLAVGKRVRILLAATGQHEVLVRAIEDQFGASRRKPAYVNDGEHLFLDFAGFSDGALPDDAYALHARDLAHAMSQRADIAAAGQRVVATVPVVVRQGSAELQLLDSAGTVRASSKLAQWPAQRSSTLDAMVALDDGLRLRIPLADTHADVPVPTPSPQRSLVARAGKALRRRVREFDRNNPHSRPGGNTP